MRSFTAGAGLMHCHSGFPLKRISTVASVKGCIQLKDKEPCFSVVRKKVLNVVSWDPVRTMDPFTFCVIAVKRFRTDGGPASISVIARLSSSWTEASADNLAGSVAGHVSILALSLKPMIFNL